MKRIIALIMVLILSLNFAGCKAKSKGTALQGEANNQTSTSVSDENEIGKNTGIEDIKCFKVNSKNQIVILGFNSAKEKKFGIYDAKGKLVKDISMDFGKRLGLFTLDAEDNIYVLSEDGGKRQITVFDASGEKTKSINLEKGINSSRDEEGDSPQEMVIEGEMAVDSKGNFYLLTFDNKSTVEMIDKDGKSIKNIYNKCRSISSDGEDNLFIGRADGEDTSSSNYYLEKMNPVSGQSIWKNKISIYKSFNKLVYRKGDKEFYAMDGDGLSKFNSSDGKLLERSIEFNQYGLVDFNSRVRNVEINKDKDAYILMVKYDRTNRLEQTELYKYNLNSKSQNDKKVITLSTSFKGVFLDVAVSKFQKKHPDIKIEVKNAIEDFNDPSCEEKYVKSVNTEMMAGKGSDIIAMHNLPYKKYVDKNMLVNLNELISKDKAFSKNDYNEKVLNSYKYKDGLYALPIDFQFKALAVDKKILNDEKINIDDKSWTLEELISTASKVTKGKQYAFPKMNGSEIMEFILLKNNYDNFIDEDKKQAKFDSKEFIELLNLAKSFTTKNIMDVKGDGMSMGSGGQIQILYGNSVFIPTDIFNSLRLGDKYDLKRLPSAGSNKGETFNCSNIFSINKNSKNINECFEFIKLMLSEEMQMGDGISFPVNKAALDKVEKQVINSTSKNKKEYMVSEDDISKLNEFINELSVKDNNDNIQIKKIVGDETDKFIKGQQTAEQAAKIIQSKVTTMLNE